MSIAVGTFALIIGIIADWKGVGPASVGNRIAQIFALLAAEVFIVGTPLAGWLKDVANQTQQVLGEVIAGASPKLGEAITSYLIMGATLVVAALWFGALLSSKLAKWVGGLTEEDHTSWLIWGGGVLLAVFANAIPGVIGDGVTGGMDLLTGFAATGLAAII